MINVNEASRALTTSWLRWQSTRSRTALIAKASLASSYYVEVRVFISLFSLQILNVLVKILRLRPDYNLVQILMSHTEHKCSQSSH